MVKNNNNKKKIEVRDGGSSSINEFVKRPLPSEKDVEAFEEKVNKRAKKEKEDNIKESLSEIYTDEKGGEIDIKKIKKKKKGGIVFWFFNLILFFLVLFGLGFGAFYYMNNMSGGEDGFDFSVEGEKSVLAGEEFFYKIKYDNKADYALNNVRISADYPDNFIFIDSFPDEHKKEGEKDVWLIDNIPPNGEGSIKVKGKLIDKESESAVFLSDISYTQSNFSSEFSKEDSYSTKIEGLGMEMSFDYPGNALVGKNENVSINLNGEEENHIGDFLLELKSDQNIEVGALKQEDEENEDDFKIEKKEDKKWKISGLGDSTKNLNLKFKVMEKISENQDLNLLFYKKNKGKKFIFKEEKIDLEIIKSDLDLNLIINGSQKGEALDFGEKLNYAINYANRGETTMENLTIMAVMESESLDWTSLEDKNDGMEKGNSITWSKEQIPELANLEAGEEGVIDFSINVQEFSENDVDKEFEVKSYAQFVADESEEEGGGATSSEDNRSNVIVNKINSDLRLDEEIRYFNEDNIPVGTGPLPPKVGEETSFKVFWTLHNNLHELNNVKVKFDLPENVEWNEKQRTSAGSITYNKEEREILWDVGKLPLAIYRADAEFSISLTPTEEDKNKILVLSSGSTVEAKDAETEDTIKKSIKAKTTKLEDDDIADMSSDGRVE